MTARLALIFSLIESELSKVTCALYRAAAATAGIESVCPSIVIGFPFLSGKLVRADALKSSSEKIYL